MPELQLAVLNAALQEPVMYAYMQSGLNGVWKSQAGDAAAQPAVV